MLSLISFILVCIGCINWFCIGILQFDFVAGIFGSQSNIFSRLIYTLVGVAAIIVIANFVTNKGKFVVSFKKANEEYKDYKAEKTSTNRRKALATESADEFTIEKELKDEDKVDDCNCGHNCECGKDHTNKNNNNKQV
ncbi:MAG: DUF378 domain-containing protein [Clostridia bacterium]|nr:DUF378 domain-containing protein [Clostridia bacterium]